VSAAKARGTRWESQVVDYLLSRGFKYAERRSLAGARDKGDITGIPGLVIECKSQQRHSLAEWCDEAETERENAGAEYGVAWIKRRGRTSAGAGYVLMDGMTFTALLHAAGYGDPSASEGAA